VHVGAKAPTSREDIKLPVRTLRTCLRHAPSKTHSKTEITDLKVGHYKSHRADECGKQPHG
jgi:hypothetical protein